METAIGQWLQSVREDVWMCVALACGFVAFHVMHTSIVYARNYPRQAATGVRSDD